MRVALRPSLFGAFAVAALACGGNAPLTSNVVNTSGAAGASGSPGAGGAAGAPPTGQAGAGGQSGPGITMCGSATLPSGQCVVNAYKNSRGDPPACVCSDDLPCVSGDTCTSLLFDAGNCGACGNRCAPTSICHGGNCGPATTNVIPARSGCTSIDLAVSGSALYWTDLGHGSVQSIPAGGGTVVTYASDEPAPSRVAVVGASVFWLDNGTAIRKGGANLAVTTVVEAAAPVGGFVVSPDGATVYFSSDMTISSVPATGGVPVVVAREEEQEGPLGGLALAGNTLTFPVGEFVNVVTLVAGQVASCDGLSEDVNCVRIAEGGELFLDTILVLPGEVIWFDASYLNLATADPSPRDLAMTDQAGTGLAANATTVYFSEGAPNAPGAGVIYKAPIALHQTALPIARGQDGPRSLAVGATKVFWSTSDCSIESTEL
jgi:hypothetical protein